MMALLPAGRAESWIAPRPDLAWVRRRVGAGLPAADNVHEVGQQIAPECRIVYVDNDPLVLVHARALLTSDPRGSTHCVEADLREPDTIVAAASELLDLTQPVAVLCMQVLGHLCVYQQARSVVHHLLDALPAGSYLAICDATNTSLELDAAQRGYNATGAVPYHPRSPAQISGFFDGLDLMEPGVVPVTHWRQDIATDKTAGVPQLGGVARKSNRRRPGRSAMAGGVR